MPSNPRWSRAWARRRRLILERDAWTCRLQYAGCTGVATQVDHITPRHFGGTDDPANLRAACAACNLGRGDGTRPAPSDPVSAW